MRPVDPVTYAEAAHILGVTPSTIRRHVSDGRLNARRGPRQHSTLSRADVEAYAVQTYRYRRHIDDPESYWVTNRRAADILGVNVARLNQLAAGAGLLVDHADSQTGVRGRHDPHPRIRQRPAAEPATRKVWRRLEPLFLMGY